MFEKNKVNSTVKTVKSAVKNQQQRKPVVIAKPVVTKPTPTTPRNVQSDNERQQPRQLSKSPRITKPQTTGPSNQFEDGTAGAVMSVGGGSVEGLTDPNVGYAVSHKNQQAKQYKDMIRGKIRKNVPSLARRKPPVL